MPSEHGTIPQAVRNMIRSRLPLGRRMALVLRNGLRRLGPPPSDCCGHPGEPGC
jgi:hypothetical protein